MEQQDSGYAYWLEFFGFMFKYDADTLKTLGNK